MENLELLWENYNEFMRTYPMDLLEKPIKKEVFYNKHDIFLEKRKLEDQLISHYKNEQEWHAEAWKRANEKK
jgi:hypothetical protein